MVKGDPTMVILGIDAHKQTHTVVVVDERGRKLVERTVKTTTKDHLDLLVWASTNPGGTDDLHRPLDRAQRQALAGRGNGPLGRGGDAEYRAQLPPHQGPRRHAHAVGSARIMLRRWLSGSAHRIRLGRHRTSTTIGTSSETREQAVSQSTDRTRRPSLPSIHDFATWEPLLRLLRVGNAESLAVPGGHVAGRIGRDGGWSLPLPPRFPRPGRALQVEDMQDEFNAVERVQGAMADVGLDDISFVGEMSSTGRTVLYLLRFGPAVEAGMGPHPGSLILVEGSVPEPWRRLPDPVPGAAPAASGDPALLERTPRERIPGATGAIEAEIAAAEARLSVALPDELKVLYRVRGGGGRTGVTATRQRSASSKQSAASSFHWTNCPSPTRRPARARGSSRRRRRSSPRPTPRCREWSAHPAGSPSATMAAVTGSRST
jgi:hypothetical protein